MNGRKSPNGLSCNNYLYKTLFASKNGADYTMFSIPVEFALRKNGVLSL